MAEENYQKIKLLRLMEVLYESSDYMHPMTTEELCAYLEQHHINCNVKTLGRDIRFLNEQGYEVLSCMQSHRKAYYCPERKFDMIELKILIDAVQAATFITPDKTEKLIQKIAELGGIQAAEILQSNLVTFNTRKHSNESVYYNISMLESAIREKKKASFYYYDLDENKEKVYRKNKWRYQVSPLALIYVDDNYYLMTYHSTYKKVVNYRIDRMTNVSVEDEPIGEEAVIRADSVTEYTEQVINMYQGETKEVTLNFKDYLINAVFDRFGEATVMKRLEDGSIEAIVRVQTSPPFWSWVFQFGRDMKIVRPLSVADDYEKFRRYGK